MPSLRRTTFKPHGIFLPNNSYSFLSFSLTNSIHFIQETSHWTVSPLIRDSFSMVNSSHPFRFFLLYVCGCAKFLIFGCGVWAFQIGSAVGGTASAFYGFNLGIHSCSSLFDYFWKSLLRFSKIKGVIHGDQLQTSIWKQEHYACIEMLCPSCLYASKICNKLELCKHCEND